VRVPLFLWMALCLMWCKRLLCICSFVIGSEIKISLARHSVESLIQCLANLSWV
jgi:hypothetical protein